MLLVFLTMGFLAKQILIRSNRIQSNKRFGHFQKNFGAATSTRNVLTFMTVAS